MNAELAKIDRLISGKPESPERIYNWQHNQMSIARHYGGLKYQGYEYFIAPNEPGAPLVRADVLAAEKKAEKLAGKAEKLKAVEAQGDFL